MSSLTYSERLAALRPILTKWRNHSATNTAETIACPGCGGQLRIMVHNFGSNGPRTSGHCENGFCLHWEDV